MMTSPSHLHRDGSGASSPACRSLQTIEAAAGVSRRSASLGTRTLPTALGEGERLRDAIHCRQA